MQWDTHFYVFAPNTVGYTRKSVKKEKICLAKTFSSQGKTTTVSGSDADV